MDMLPPHCISPFPSELLIKQDRSQVCRHPWCAASSRVKTCHQSLYTDWTRTSSCQGIVLKKQNMQLPRDFTCDQTSLSLIVSFDDALCDSKEPRFLELLKKDKKTVQCEITRLDGRVRRTLSSSPRRRKIRRFWHFHNILWYLWSACYRTLDGPSNSQIYLIHN